MIGNQQWNSSAMVLSEYFGVMKREVNENQ
jgi:hypothetical protein